MFKTDRHSAFDSEALLIENDCGRIENEIHFGESDRSGPESRNTYYNLCCALSR